MEEGAAIDHPRSSQRGASRCCVLDSSIILNFLAAPRGFQLLTQFLSGRGIVTYEVLEELRRPPASHALRRALGDGDFVLRALETLSELETFGRLLGDGRLDTGEASCIAAAETLGCSVAIDERAGTELARSRLGPDRVYDTLQLVSQMVDASMLTVAEAEALVHSMRAKGRRVPPWTAS